MRLCRDCKFYMGSLCKKFREVDIVTGEKSYYYARNLRANEKCGINATQFEENKYKMITLPYYYTITNPHVTISLVLAASYVSVLGMLLRQ